MTGVNAGRISLGAAITGFLLAAFMVIGAAVLPRVGIGSALSFIGFTLFILFESLALVFGIVGRRTDSGLAGLTLACALLLLLFCLASAVVKAVAAGI
jgi:hypothetical protein